MADIIKGLIFSTIVFGLLLWAMSAWGPVVVPAFAEFAANYPGLTVLIGVVLLIYLIPSMVAVGRKRENAAAIVALNLFLGWTLLGWLGSLIWALTTPKSDAPIATPKVVEKSEPGPPPISTPSGGDVVEKLAKAAELHFAGRLSDDEFADLKKRLLASN